MFIILKKPPSWSALEGIPSLWNSKLSVCDVILGGFIYRILLRCMCEATFVAEKFDTDGKGIKST
jgi:hypothetical protein